MYVKFLILLYNFLIFDFTETKNMKFLSLSW